MSAFVNGIIVGTMSLGGLLGLIGLGFTTIYRTTRVVNFSHGAFITLGAFLFVTFHHLGSFPAIVLAVAINAAVGIVVYYLLIERTLGGNVFSVVIMTFGLSIVMIALISMIWGTDVRYTNLKFRSSSIHLLGLTFTGLQISALIAAVVGIACIGAGMRYTAWGLRARAISQDAWLAANFGVPVGRIGAIAWALSFASSTLAGIVYASMTSVDLTLSDVGLLALPGLMLGGLDSIVGAVVGGVLMGGLITLLTAYTDPNYATIASYGVLIVVLVCIPQGIFGTRQSRLI